MSEVIPSLSFSDKAKEAVDYYINIFHNSQISHIIYVSKEMANMSGLDEGSVSAIYFEIEKRPLFAVNTGPMFKFTPAISLMIPVDNQEYLDEIWHKLSQGGKEMQAGWIEDKFGVTWQIVFNQLNEMLQDKDQTKVDRVMAALFETPKLNLAKLQQAYQGISYQGI